MPEINNPELRFGLEKSFKIVHKSYAHLMNLKEDPGSNTYNLLNEIRSGNLDIIKKCDRKSEEEFDEAKGVIQGTHKHPKNTPRQDMINETQQAIYWPTLLVVGKGVDYNIIDVPRFLLNGFYSNIDPEDIYSPVFMEGEGMKNNSHKEIISSFRLSLAKAGKLLKDFNKKFGEKYKKIEPEDIAVWDLEQMLKREYLKDYINNKIIEEGTILKPQFEKRGGNLPTIIQDYDNPHVLYGLDFLNKKEFDHILKERVLDYISRVNEILVDCDQDTFIFKAHNLRGMFKPNFSILKEKDKDKINFENDSGLIPAIAHDTLSGEVLMLAYANKDALDITFKKGLATFYSTSRKELWTKGETSGDYLKIENILTNRTKNVLLYHVKMAGKGACHTKNIDDITRKSCFSRQVSDNNTLEFLPSMY